MSALNAVQMADSRRPSGFGRPPDVELDCRASVNGGALTLKTALEEARRFDAGQILAIRMEFTPALLCRVMANRGFKQWSESDGNGGLRIYFLKERR